MNDSASEPLSVPTDAVLAEVTAQRNTAMDELAQWRALAQRLLAERNEPDATGTS